MRRNTCKHVQHKPIEYRVKTSPDRSGIPTSIISGWNPIHRRFEICDEGFIMPKAKLRNTEN